MKILKNASFQKTPTFKGVNYMIKSLKPSIRICPYTYIYLQAACT